MILKIRLFMLIIFFCYLKGNTAIWRNWPWQEEKPEASNGVGEITASEIRTNEKPSSRNRSGTGKLTTPRSPFYENNFETTTITNDGVSGLTQDGPVSKDATESIFGSIEESGSSTTLGASYVDKNEYFTNPIAGLFQESGPMTTPEASYVDKNEYSTEPIVGLFQENGTMTTPEASYVYKNEYSTEPIAGLFQESGPMTTPRANYVNKDTESISGSPPPSSSREMTTNNEYLDNIEDATYRTDFIRISSEPPTTMNGHNTLRNYSENVTRFPDILSSTYPIEELHSESTTSDKEQTKGDIVYTTGSEYLSTPASEIASTPYPFDINDFETVTGIQGILKEMNTNERIEQKIVKAMNEFSSNCNIYKPIILSIKNFSLPSEQRIDLGQAIARFFNFRISELNEENDEWKTYTTIINCDSSHSVKMKVSVPSRITISADIQVIDSLDDVLSEGSISVKLRGVNILKQFINNPINNKTRKGIPFPDPELSFAKSEVSLDIGMSYQLPIYRHLDAFFNELTPLQEFYSRQLHSKIENAGISLSDSCSNILDVAEHSAKNKALTNLYIIRDVKFETWRGLTLSAGPILIDGLLNFDSTKFIVVKPETSILRANYQPENKVIKRIKTENLNGRFEWQYRGKTNVLSFSIDQIDFESIFTKRAVVGDEIWSTTMPADGQTMSYYDNTDRINTNINVKVGKVEIEPSQEKYCENENHFANFILSGYLQSMIENLLKNSIRDKFISELSLDKCDNF